MTIIRLDEVDEPSNCGDLDQWRFCDILSDKQAISRHHGDAMNPTHQRMSHASQDVWALQNGFPMMLITEGDVV